MVSDLQHVKGPALVAGYAGREQLRVDLLFDIAGEQEASLAIAELQHDGDVVDCLAGVRWTLRHPAATWPVDIDTHAVEIEAIASRQ
jgi:hypothetical protein